MTVEPYDEEKIGNEDVIIRRISPVQHIVPDENRNRNRISSMAYRTSSRGNRGMSVDIEALITSSGQDARQFVITPVYTGAVAFSAGAIRALDLRVGYDPIPDNPYHGEVWAQSGTNRFSNAQERGLRLAARWYVELPDVVI